MEHLSKIITVTGLLSSLILVWKDFLSNGYCPKILRIPACYLVLGCYAMTSVYIFQIIHVESIFLLGSFSGVLIAFWFSFTNVLKLNKCPVFLTIPLCYLSLIAFVLLIMINYKKMF